MKNNFKWKRGEKAYLAKQAKILPQNLSEILRGERGVSYLMAIRLEKCCQKMSKRISWQTWMTLSRGN